jgi:hypothetical protein
LQGEVAGLATAVGAVARGAYITETMFTETTAQSAEAMDGLLHVLSDAADAMQSCAQRLADYLGRIFIEFEAADLALAEHVNRTVEQGGRHA